MTEVRLSGYTVLVRRGAIDSLGGIVRDAAPAHRYAIVSDAQVAVHYAERAVRSFGSGAPAVLTIPPGEREKTRERWSELTDRLLGAGFGRDSVIVALGGGVVGDLAGFVAATFMRGIPVVQVPTSLLAMIDASVGGKTGVDTPAGKNLVGAFHQPAAVVVDPGVLETLPLEHRRAGMAEAIKHGVIADEGYFSTIERSLPSLLDDPASEEMLGVILRSIEIKADVVDRDEGELGVRKALNFGHTIGHAIEMLSGYELLHGEAIAIGMVLEGRLAERLGLSERGTAHRIEQCVRAAGLPAERPDSVSPGEIVLATHGDKKARGGKVEYALPARIGSMAEARNHAIAVDDESVLEALEG